MNASPARSKHRGTWFVAILGAIEIAILVAFLANRTFASAACGLVGSAPQAESSAVAAPPVASQADTSRAAGAGAAGTMGTAGGTAAAGGGAMAAGSGGAEAQSASSGGTITPSAVASAPPESSTAAASSEAQGGDAGASGDTNQIVDPNCVAKTAASLLSSGTAPPAGPTCGPMKQPQALKDAEKQISH
jgi:hypothetical protein